LVVTYTPRPKLRFRVSYLRMDSLTQITLGAAVGEAVLGHRVGKKAPLWGAAFGTLPDLDVLANPFVTEMQALALHRGFSHSLLFIVLATPLLGRALYRLHGGASWRAWGALVGMTLGTHVLLDCMTAYGTQVFYPFSNYPVIFGTIFIIDPLYTVPLAGGLLVACWFRRDNRRRRWANYIGLGLSTAYLLLTVGNKLYATATFEDALKAQDIAYERLFTKPMPFNTVYWTAIAEDSTGFWIGYHSLLGDPGRIDFRWIPKRHHLLGAARDSEAVERLRWFSRGYFTVRRAGNTLLIHDLRFGRNDLGLTEDGRYLFTFRLSRSSAGQVTGFNQVTPPFEFSTSLLRRYWARLSGKAELNRPFSGS
jgi:inner membrane protein